MLHACTLTLNTSPTSRHHTTADPSRTDCTGHDSIHFSSACVAKDSRQERAVSRIATCICEVREGGAGGEAHVARARAFSYAFKERPSFNAEEEA